VSPLGVVELRCSCFTYGQGITLDGRDIIVIGASAGGVQAVCSLAAGLAPDLPAALFVVIHTASEFPSALPELLTRRGPFHATHALHGEEVVRGRIYVAPPDNQLRLRPGYVHVVRGPKENGYRPSVDALFRAQLPLAERGEVLQAGRSGHDHRVA
jgi:two-component system chemotaxis response regulator CheB